MQERKFFWNLDVLDQNSEMIDVGMGYVLETKDKRVIVLNSTASFILKNSNGRTIEEITALLSKEIDSDDLNLIDLKEDVTTFVQELEKEGLVENY